MGLDINYYRRLMAAPTAEVDADGYPVDYDHFVKFGGSMDWSEGNWPGRAAPLNAETIYSWREKGRFRAGSYGGYGSWRRELAEMPAAKSHDFEELTNFADNEGVIGSVVAVKLASDFARNQERANVIGGYFLEKYNEWREAFEVASDSGAVEFT